MVPKPVVFSIHAREQMKTRGITRQQVRWLIARGVREDRKHGYFLCRGYRQHREAAVLCHEDASRLLVVTVMWTDEKPRRGNR